MRSILMLVLGFIALQAALGEPEPRRGDPDDSVQIVDRADPHRRIGCRFVCNDRQPNAVCAQPYDRPNQPHRLFGNYCVLRRHNCRQPHNRFRADVSLDHCSQSLAGTTGDSVV